MGEPGRGAGRGVLPGDVGVLGMRQQVELDPGEPRFEAVQLGEGFGDVGRGQLGQPDPTGQRVVEDLVDPAGEPVHPVAALVHRQLELRWFVGPRHGRTL